MADSDGLYPSAADAEVTESGTFLPCGPRGQKPTIVAVEGSVDCRAGKFYLFFGTLGKTKHFPKEETCAQTRGVCEYVDSKNSFQYGIIICVLTWLLA